MFCFNDFDPKKFRFLRILICLFLVLCILVNCSPLRARATGIAVGIGIGVTTIAGLIALAYGVQISPDQLPSAASDLETALNNGVSSGALTKDVLDLWWTAASGGKIKLETANRAIADIVVDWVERFHSEITVSSFDYPHAKVYSANSDIQCSAGGSFSVVNFPVDVLHLGFYFNYSFDSENYPEQYFSQFYNAIVALEPNVILGSSKSYITIDGVRYYTYFSDLWNAVYPSDPEYSVFSSLISNRIEPPFDVNDGYARDYYLESIFLEYLASSNVPVSSIGGLHGVITDGTGILDNTSIPDINLGSSSYAGGLYGSNDDDGYINDNILSAGSFIWADLIADLGGKSATITIEDEEGKTHVYPITDTGLGDEILTPSETLPGTGTETGVGTAPVSDFLSWLYDLLIRALQWLVDALGLRALAEWLVEVLLGGITGILDNVVELILAGIKAIFVPSTDYLTAKVEALRARFGFMDSVLATGEAIIAALNLSGTPPVIYAHFENAEGAFNWGGTVAVLDMTWYSRYKPAGDAFLSGVIWIFFLWRVFIKLPSIISGVSGTVRTFDSIDSGK